MKYLIVRDSELGQIEVPLVFDAYLSHQTIGRALNVIAGGFVDIRGRKRDCGDKQDCDAYCYGEAPSLGVKSRGKADAAIIIESMHRREAE